MKKILSSLALTGIIASFALFTTAQKYCEKDRRGEFVHSFKTVNDTDRQLERAHMAQFKFCRTMDYYKTFR